VAAAVLIGSGAARAADMPDYYDPPPTGRPAGPPSFSSRFVGEQGVRWEGIIAGATAGYLNLNSNFDEGSDVTSTSGHEFGGFFGYNADWDGLILGAEAAYNRPAALTGGSQNGSKTITLTDEVTARARAGYPIGLFLPYGFIGGALARANYTTLTASQSNVFAYGVAAGLGVDLRVLPNVFLRAEWEYNWFANVGGIQASTNTGRVGVGLRF
jgi:opacity protein-like surface antigen